MRAAFSSLAFFLGAAGTAFFAPNPLILIGGTGLGISALLTLIKPTTEASKILVGRAINSFAMLANIILITNGVFMTAHGLQQNTLFFSIAGALLATANLIYLYANGRSLLMGNFHQHPSFCIASGFLISAAGFTLRDNTLIGIGVLFIIEATLRLPQKGI